MPDRPRSKLHVLHFVAAMSACTSACGRVAEDAAPADGSDDTATTTTADARVETIDATVEVPIESGPDVSACLEGGAAEVAFDGATGWAERWQGRGVSEPFAMSTDDLGRVHLLVRGAQIDLGGGLTAGASDTDLVAVTVEPTTGAAKVTVVVDDVMRANPPVAPFAVGRDGTIAMIVSPVGTTRVTIHLDALTRTVDDPAGDPLLVVVPPDRATLLAMTLPGASSVGIGQGPDRSIAVMGTLDGPRSFGSVTLTPVSDPSSFVVSLEPTGAVRWARALRGLPLSNVAVDGVGATAVVTVDARYDETGLLVDAGALHVFELSMTGDQRFEVLAPGDHPFAQPEPPTIAFEAPGKLVLAGNFYRTFLLGTRSVESFCSAGAAFFASLDAAGAIGDLSRLDVGKVAVVNSLAIATGGDVVVGGSRACGGHLVPIPGHCSNCAFVTRTKRDGTRVFDAEWGPNVCEGFVAAPATGPLVIAGSFEGRIELGGTTLDGRADGAIFVASLPP